MWFFRCKQSIYFRIQWTGNTLSIFTCSQEPRWHLFRIPIHCTSLYYNKNVHHSWHCDFKDRPHISILKLDPQFSFNAPNKLLHINWHQKYHNEFFLQNIKPFYTIGNPVSFSFLFSFFSNYNFWKHFIVIPEATLDFRKSRTYYFINVWQMEITLF